MMESLNILAQNKGFLLDAYGMHPIMGLFFFLTIVDIALKGWALWRAGRMGKKVWFVALLLVNSVGILPLIFLLVTNWEYTQKTAKKGVL